MAETDLTVARLDLAGEQVQALQRGLSQRQGALLELEHNTRRVRAGSLDGRILVDQAEDLRRAVRIHQSDQLGEVPAALARADVTVADATRDDTLTPGDAQGLARRVATATRESRRADSDLDRVVEALAPLAAADAARQDLARIAQRGIDGAAGSLEQARRATFRLSEDLPEIARDLRRLGTDQDLGAPVAPGHDLDRRPAVGSDRRLATPRMAPPMGGPGRGAGYAAAPSR